MLADVWTLVLHVHVCRRGDYEGRRQLCAMHRKGGVSAWPAHCRSRARPGLAQMLSAKRYVALGLRHVDDMMPGDAETALGARVAAFRAARGFAASPPAGHACRGRGAWCRMPGSQARRWRRPRVTWGGALCSGAGAVGGGLLEADGPGWPGA